MTFYHRDGSAQHKEVSSEERVPAYIVGKPEPLLRSPLRKVSVRTEQDENEAVYYTVADSSGLLLLGRSYIGVKTDLCDFSQGLSFVRQKPAEITDQKYDNISGKRKTSRNYYSETVLTYEKDGFYFGGTTFDFDVPGPLEYADLIFDKIEEIVDANRKYISIARTPGDLYEDKRHGRKSIMLGIENGLALNHDVANVKHFAQRGVVYITLCHNGDNDICDSAKGCNTHNGVSAFGEKVIQAMNANGMMVDLSHANEKSFYDALEISRTPIVCSHSSSRTLCDHPRNLTDDQMRALAAKGGVAHTTLYHGFLRKEGEATILDALAHLEHAIAVMGIDHVGLGTDFDGDGGVVGMANSSEAINFTLHLLRRKYSERDIEKIWGGNWLRVMAQVQRMDR